MIKKIDARIAELEAEEKAEQEKKLTQTKVDAKVRAGKATSTIEATEKPTPVIKTVEKDSQVKSSHSKTEANIKEEKEKKQKQKEAFAAKITAKVNNESKLVAKDSKKEEKTKVETKPKEHNVKKEVITDDQFFDDFFADDEDYY